MVTDSGKKYLVKENTKKFLRFQLTAIMATTIDFLTTIILKEIFKMPYPIAVALGAGAGAITAFSINRYWVFRSIEKHPFNQLLRYLIVAFDIR